MLQNPLLGRLAFELEKEGVGKMAPNGQVQWNQLANVDFGEFFRNIGNQVRSVSGIRPPQPTENATAPSAGTPSQASEREARKASIVNLPTAAARATPPPEPKPESRADILASMKKAFTRQLRLNPGAVNQPEVLAEAAQSLLQNQSFLSSMKSALNQVGPGKVYF